MRRRSRRRGSVHVSRVSLQYVRNLALLFVRTDTRLGGFRLLLQFALVFAFGSITHAESSSLLLLRAFVFHRWFRSGLRFIAALLGHGTHLSFRMIRTSPCPASVAAASSRTTAGRSVRP